MTRQCLLVVLFSSLMSIPAGAQSPCVSYWYDDVTNLRLQPFEDEQFTICYSWQYADDVEFARIWLRRALEVGRIKYGLIEPMYQGLPLRTVVFLTPTPTGSTQPGIVRNAGFERKGDMYINEIHYLTPSVWPNWTGYGVCFPSMEEYHAHFFVHEMIHTVQYGLINDDTTSWTMEALAEYDAYHYSTEWNRTGGVNNLIELAHWSHQDRIFYQKSILQSLVDDTVIRPEAELSSEHKYVGGPVVMQFFAEQFGERVHLELLQTTQWEVVKNRRGVRFWDFWQDFRRWFGELEEHQTTERCSNRQ